MPPLPRMSTASSDQAMLVDKPLYRNVVGVRRRQVAVVVDDRVDRVDRPRRRFDLVDGE
jgi:hypothetical protein